MTKNPLSAEHRQKIALTRRNQEAEKKVALKQLRLGLAPGMNPPEAGEILSVKNPPLITANRLQSNAQMFRGMTLSRISAVLESTQTGVLRQWMEFCDKMGEDDHLAGLVTTRKNAVAGKPLSVQARVDSPEARRAALFVEEQLHDVRDLNALAYHLLNATFTGIAAAETIWCYEAGIYKIAGFENLHGKMLNLNEELAPVFSNVLTFSQPELINQPLADFPGSFIVHTPGVLSMYPNRDGLFRAAAFEWFFKHRALGFWLSGAERYAMPLLIATVPTATDPGVMTSLRNDLESLSSDTITVLKQGTTISQIGANAQSGADAWRGLVSQLNSGLTKLITGGTLAVDAGSVGSNALGEVHERTRADISLGDAERLARTLERDLVWWILWHNRHLFGGNMPPVPSLYFDGVARNPAITDLHVRAGVVRKNDLRRELALPLLTIEEGGEDLIPGEQVSAFPGGAPANGAPANTAPAHPAPAPAEAPEAPEEAPEASDAPDTKPAFSRAV